MELLQSTMQKRRKSKNLLVSLFFFSWLIFVNHADCSFLKIIGQNGLEFTLKDQEVSISGVYIIKNQGDETARNLVLDLKLGNWVLLRKIESLEPEQSKELKINEKFSQNLLQCSPNLGPADLESCISQSKFPLQGAFPLFILRHYEDLNGFRFSSAEVLRVIIGNLTETESSSLTVPNIDGKMDCEGDGQEFDCEIVLKNTGKTAISSEIIPFTSKELEFSNVLSSVEMLGGKTETVTLKLVNFRGIQGSSYAVHVILTWNDGKLQQMANFGSSILVQPKPELKSNYILFAVVGFVLSLLIFALVIGFLKFYVSRFRRSK